MRVVIVERVTGNETVVAVVDADDGRVLHAVAGIGVTGAALGVVDAVRWATEHGALIVPALWRAERRVA